MNTNYTPEQVELIDSLRSEDCPGCDDVKVPGRSFCRTCYGRLPTRLKKSLYDLVGHGYEAAFAESLKRLKG